MHGRTERKFVQLVTALSWEETEALVEMANTRGQAKAKDVLVELVNTGDSPEELARFRELCPKVYDIAKGPDSELVTFRNELRLVWEKKQFVEIGRTLSLWLKRYPIDPDLAGQHFPGWIVFYQSRRFVPTAMNIRATAAALCLENARLLGRCSNPECNRYYIAKRLDQKYCLEADCLRYGNRIRANKHWHRKSVEKKRRAS